ncbi:hypothetical protein [Bradyrhizobium sp. SZCCHNR1039]|uniref:hypothetical protein n=1 Tax=Bradyrhizobium sp. SZCCHNR1039 TaxID=3057350 RepID=UPI0029167447|nr:hypothetical protein [Bradyrhizobium sp. SZCCHNR1039]
MISTYIKDANRLLAMTLPDIDRVMLMIAKQVRQALFFLPSDHDEPFGTGMATERSSSYPFRKQAQVDDH